MWNLPSAAFRERMSRSDKYHFFLVDRSFKISVTIYIKSRWKTELWDGTRKPVEKFHTYLSSKVRKVGPKWISLKFFESPLLEMIHGGKVITLEIASETRKKLQNKKNFNALKICDGIIDEEHKVFICERMWNQTRTHEWRNTKSQKRSRKKAELAELTPEKPFSIPWSRKSLLSSFPPDNLLATISLTPRNTSQKKTQKTV